MVFYGDGHQTHSKVPFGHEKACGRFRFSLQFPELIQGGIANRGEDIVFLFGQREFSGLGQAGRFSR
jgi:hypothetical protein